MLEERLMTTPRFRGTTSLMDLLRNLLSVIGFAAVVVLFAVAMDEETRLRLTLPREQLLSIDSPEARLSAIGPTSAPDAIMPVSLQATDSSNSTSNEIGAPGTAAPLTREQRLAARWLARKYRVSLDAVEDIVLAAFEAARKVELDPYLLLAVMSIESGFNPLAESAVGAQGLMQVMTRMHSEKFQAFGGPAVALDPIANIRVGAMILRDYVQRAGNMEGALKYYVGAANHADDGGYGGKVLAERTRIRQAASGKNVPFNDPAPQPVASKPPANQASAYSVKTPQIELSSTAGETSLHVPGLQSAQSTL